MPEITPVIFRKWKDSDDIIALFPAMPGTLDPYTCGSYAHNGQHATADPVEVMRGTIPARAEEYAELRREMESYPYYYEFKVYSRLGHFFLERRREALAECAT